MTSTPSRAAATTTAASSCFLAPPSLAPFLPPPSQLSSVCMCVSCGCAAATTRPFRGLALSPPPLSPPLSSYPPSLCTFFRRSCRLQSSCHDIYVLSPFFFCLRTFVCGLWRSVCSPSGVLFFSLSLLDRSGSKDKAKLEQLCFTTPFTTPV